VDETFVLVAFVPGNSVLVMFPLLLFVVFAILVVMGQTKIGLGETILRLPCLESGFGTCRHNMLFRTAERAPVETVPSFLLPPTCMGLDMGGSLVAPPRFPIPVGWSWVLAVSVSLFLEAVGVVRVVVLVILRPRSLHFLVPRS